MSDYLDGVAQDIRAQVPEPALPPPGDAPVALFRIYALLARAKGEATTLEDVHDAWSVWMGSHDPDHGALVPFGELTTVQQGQDQPFLDAIHAYARSRR